MYELDDDKEFNFNDWYDFLRDMLRNTVIKEQKTVFMISDNQIADEKMLEDVNNLLNIGEIPNLYTADEKENLLEELKDLTSKYKMHLNPL